MIAFYGYAVRKNGKYLGFSPRQLNIRRFYNNPRYPCVSFNRDVQEQYNGHLGEVVRVKLTMEEVKDGK